MPAFAELRRSTRAVLCLECGKCSSACPLAPFGGFSAARVAALRDFDESRRGGGGAVSRCLTCGACEVLCPSGVRYVDFVLGLRGELPAERRHPCPHGAALQTAARLSAALPDAKRPSDWLEDDLRVSEEGEIALFVGCLPLFDDLLGEELGLRTTEIARAAVRALNRLGIEPVIVPEERCCGHDLLWSGDRKTFERLAAANAAAFAARGVETILTTCAECCRTLTLDYPGAVSGFRPRVQHLAEFLSERIDRIDRSVGSEAKEEGGPRPRDGDARRVTYHDPCRLGRHLGVYDAPRRLLDALPGADRVEMDRSGPDALCCGSPGFVRCDAASRGLQSRRLESAAATGAAKMLTTCPKCLIHFTCAQREDALRGRRRRAIEVEDLTVFAAELLERGAGGDPGAAATREGDAQ